MEDRESSLSGSPLSDYPPTTTNIPSQPTLEKTLGGATGEMDFSGGGGSGDVAVKKKRGRPRKYDADGNLTPGYKSPPSAPAPAAIGFGYSTQSVELPASSKRGRGKSGGSGRWQMSPCLGAMVSNTAGWDFTPHVVIVQNGEDVVAKIISFSQTSPRGVCVLSANGAVSNATIRQPGSSGGLLTYEGRFEILSLKGSYTVSENGGMKSRTGGLSVSLASSDGRVIGGGLAGLLVAASPIQMVVASFMQSGSAKVQKRKQYEPRTTPLAPAAGADTVIPATPISEAAPNNNNHPYSEAAPNIKSYGYSESAPNINNYQIPATHKRIQNYGEENNETHNNEAHNHDNDHDMSEKQNPNSSSDSGEWNISDQHSGQRSYPDINVSLLVD